MMMMMKQLWPYPYHHSLSLLLGTWQHAPISQPRPPPVPLSRTLRPGQPSSAMREETHHQHPIPIFLTAQLSEG